MNIIRLENFGEKVDQDNAIRIPAHTHTHTHTQRTHTRATWTEVNTVSHQSG